jgi:hypothetical protein
MGEENDGALEARAAENAKTLPDWTTEKQRRYEQLLQDEREEYARCRKARDEVDNIDMAVVVTSIVEQSPPDPWQTVLSDIENLPNTEGSLERGNGYVKVTSQFLLGNVLGISREKVHQNHAIRLSRVMECLGWEKPPNIWIGAKPAKGYRKSVD